MNKFLKISLVVFIMSGLNFEIGAEQNLSHAQRASSFEQSRKAMVERIANRGDLPYATVQRQLEMVNQLSEFELGRFLIERGGLNGYWTHYVITYPEKKEIEGKPKPFNSLESFILDSAPTCLATQQRYQIFKSQIQQRIKEGCSFASIPCGLMGELLDLDYSGLDTFSLWGIDLDAETLDQAREHAAEQGLLIQSHFLEKDAWKLDLEEQFDLIASNGLAIYEHDDQKVVLLYKQFFDALKPNGVLVTSFLTPPPAPGLTTAWLSAEVRPQDAILQKILFVDVLGVKWQAYRTEETVRNQLKQAGFCEIEILYDKAHIFPTVIAKKSS
ncbi:MAG: class I SAM-dependent methyltransferase [Chlamydiales bacterium]|nr:class I SAM-dependent methyltransferase [Chlamydiales bacterium]